MSTTQLTDYSGLYTDLQNRAREQTGVTATKTIAQRWINIALQDMHIGFGERFYWAERQAQLITQPKYTTGTLAVSKGSATLTGTGTAWDTDNDFSVKNMRAGGKIVIEGAHEVYEIDAVASDTSATMTSSFVKTTVTAAAYVYFEDEYALHADFLRPLDLQNFDIRGEIRLTDRKTFRERHSRNAIPGKPRTAIIQDKGFSGSTTPVRKVRFAQPPDEAYLIPYAFVTNKLAVDASGTALTNLASDTDEPIVPLQYRHAIVFHALYHMYRDRKDDTRAEAAKADYTDIMLRISGDTEVGAKKARFAPIIGPYRQAAKTPYRSGRGGRYVTGAAFDQLRE